MSARTSGQRSIRISVFAPVLLVTVAAGVVTSPATPLPSQDPTIASVRLVVVDNCINGKVPDGKGGCKNGDAGYAKPIGGHVKNCLIGKSAEAAGNEIGKAAANTNKGRSIGSKIVRGIKSLGRGVSRNAGRLARVGSSKATGAIGAFVCVTTGIGE